MRLRALVAGVLELGVDEVPDGADLAQDLGVDSLEKVELALRVESEFGIPLSAEESARFTTVEAGAAVLAERLANLDTPDESTDRIDFVRLLVGRHCSDGSAADDDRLSYLDPLTGPVSYRQLHAAAGRYAAGLAAAGVPAGSRGLVVADDSVATVIAVLGLWWHGCVPVVAAATLLERDLVAIATECRAQVLHLDVSPAKAAALDAGLVAAGVSDLVRTDGDAVRAGLGEAADRAGSGPANLLSEPSAEHSTSLSADRPATFAGSAEALVQYTSGSTGEPKGVRHSAAGIVAMIDLFGRAVPLRTDDRVLSTARLSFGYGFGSSLLCPLAAGASVVLLRGGIDSAAVAAALGRYRPNVLCSVPRLYEALLSAQAAGRLEPMPPLRLCLTAGENCPAGLSERIARAFGADVVNCLGATEVMHVVIASAPPYGDGSLGRAVPGVTVTVRGEDGRPVPDGEPGRLHVAGPTVALGYLDRPEAQARTFADGGAYTGDVVVRAADGRLHYRCRADDILNLGGYKVAPREIEDVVRKVSGVAECAVVGVADELGLQQAVLYAVPGSGIEPSTLRRAIRHAIRGDLAAFKRPSRIELVDALPVTVTGKLASYRLRQQAVRS